MKAVTNLALGLTTVATMGMLTVSMAAEPIGPGEENMAPPEGPFMEHMEERNPEMFAKMQARHEEMESKRESLEAALEASDYEAFVEALGEHLPEEMSEEKFGQMVEVHALIEAGDKEGAKALADEYGLKGMRFHFGPRGEHLGERGMKIRHEFKGRMREGMKMRFDKGFDATGAAQGA